MALKNNLLDIRLTLKIKKGKDFADFLCLNKDQYYRYENNLNQPDSTTLYKIFKKLKSMESCISIDDFTRWRKGSLENKNLDNALHLEDIIYDDLDV